jgi:hypothetical protein
MAKASGVNGLVDFTWQPGYPGFYANYTLAASGDRIYVGGDFQSIGGAPRNGLAAFPVTLPDRLFATNFEIYSP